MQLKLTEIKQQSQKHSLITKESQRVLAEAMGELKLKKAPANGRVPIDTSNRIKDTIAAFALAADKRREQLNQKRTSSTSSTWIQSLPGVPGPLKKSLWYKMHRRRQQIVLRPSPESLSAELQTSVKKSLLKSEVLRPGAATTVMAGELQKAEQAFLLAAYPLKADGESSSAVPTSSSAWAEPGKSPGSFSRHIAYV